MQSEIVCCCRDDVEQSSSEREARKTFERPSSIGIRHPKLYEAIKQVVSSAINENKSNEGSGYGNFMHDTGNEASTVMTWNCFV
jgi:hypothetical protein